MKENVGLFSAIVTIIINTVSVLVTIYIQAIKSKANLEKIEDITNIRNKNINQNMIKLSCDVDKVEKRVTSIENSSRQHLIDFHTNKNKKQ